MAGDDLTVFLFFLGTSVPFGLEAMKAETAFRRVTFWVLAGACLFTAVFWLPIKAAWPTFSQQIAVVGTNPVSWFVVAMFLLAVFAFHRPKDMREHPPKPTEQLRLFIGPKAPEAHKTTTASGERVFTRLTPPELMALLQDKTSVQAAALASPHMNKWMHASGTVREVSRWKDGEVSVLLKNEGEVAIAARFIGENADQAVHLTKEANISVIGIFNSIDYGIITLMQCELT